MREVRAQNLKSGLLEPLAWVGCARTPSMVGPNIPGFDSREGFLVRLKSSCTSTWIAYV